MGADIVDNKKELERAELHRTIWSIANDLRGSVDGWDFKQYVLGMLFYRYISENLANYINQGEIEAGYTDFRYEDLADEEAEQAREDMVSTKGFFILPSQLFCNVHKKAEHDENLNETLENSFRSIEASAQGSDSEDDFKGLFDDIDVNSNKLGGTVAKRNEKLVKLMDGIGSMQLGNYQDNTIDAFGDAYEYLMGMYASNAGKSGGEYYTPQEVSELLTRLTLVGKTEVNKVYDPACGSGSLLLKFAKVLGRDNVRQGFYGQEINITTYNLCRINMFLHDIDYDKFDIAERDNNAFNMPDKEAAEKVKAFAESKMSVGDSIGGVIECRVTGMMTGIGNPTFEKLDANLAKAIMSIGAVKGFEIGDGFGAAKVTGKYNNDEFVMKDGRVGKLTNHSGGVLGGISDGDEIVFRAAVKPTPSISALQETVNKQGEDIEVSIKGRHDPMIVPRAVVVVEAMTALTLVDLIFDNMTARMDKVKEFYRK